MLRIKNFLVKFAFVIAKSPLISSKFRTFLYRLSGMKLLDNACILPRCNFRSSNLSIGIESFINDGTTIFNEYAPVTIGNHCAIGPEVMMCTTTHIIGKPESRADKHESKPIIIEDGCWIGTRAVLLPGIIIRKGCIIAAGSVVTKNCEPNGLYAGVPAQRIKDLP
ncbi:acyltransferase [Neobacillus vireti]|uniref:acyltransferase n=1 Tax=Neobacillus vireti TaxID=220686 RepID=UPI002FFE35ED